jgi:hypothetical protein
MQHFATRKEKQQMKQITKEMKKYANTNEKRTTAYVLSQSMTAQRTFFLRCSIRRRFCDDKNKEDKNQNALKLTIYNSR